MRLTKRQTGFLREKLRKRVMARWFFMKRRKHAALHTLQFWQRSSIWQRPFRAAKKKLREDKF